MLKLETLKQCLWRNVHAPEPVLAGTIAFDDAFHWTTGRLPREVRVLLERWLPSTSISAPLSAPELIAHIAQHIQLQCDVATAVSGVASRDEAQRKAVVFFSCQDFSLGTQSLSLAVQLADRLTRSDITPEGLAKSLESCTEAIKRTGLEPTTLEMVRTASRRGIPWVRLSPLLRHVQLGQGHRQQRLWATTLSDESALARDYSRNKILTLNILSQIRLPVGRYAVVKDIAGARKSAKEIGYPLVLKPVDGMQGQSVFVDLRNEAELTEAMAAAQLNERPYMMQSFFPGDDHRLLVVSGKLVAAARKDAGSVTGDGHHTIAELVEIENRDPRRVSGRVMARIPLDERSDGMLARQGYTRGSVVEAGRAVRVNGMANVSAGATTVDVMDVIHPDNARAAIRAAKAIGLNICGVDFVCPDISKSWHDVGGGICEVNASVGLRPHLQATPHLAIRDVLLQALYPDGDDGRIPIAMVTGTMGKTSTSTMLASILSSAGHVVGCATTEGVRIDTELVERGDLASADGASIVLRDATVTAAVLETARGGIVKTGLYVDRCDVAALLNVQREQIEMDGIETLDDMLALKRKVLDVARKAVILNADDPRCLALASEFRTSPKTILFSRSPDSAALRDHVAGGGDALFLAKKNGREMIIVASGSDEVPLLATADVPATNDGLIWFHGTNAMAAAALAIGLGIELDAIRAGLRRYGREYSAAALRTVFAEGFPMRVMFDSSGKAPGYAAAVTVTDAVEVAGKRICVITLPGNRPDWAFADAAAALAGHFDRYICFEREEYRRGRKPGEIPARLADALIAAGVTPSAVFLAGPHTDAAKRLAEQATEQDFVVVFATDSPATVEEYRTVLCGIRAPT